MRATIIPATAVGLMFATLATGAMAQQAKTYVGDVVMTSSGSLGPSWRAGRACTSPSACEPIIYHVKTGEIARYGDTWATDFVATGRGKEVWRAESAKARAVRLSRN